MSDRRAADHRYSVSEKGRARRRKADAKYSARRRARRYGVEVEDIEKLIEAQGGRCLFTGEPITSRSHVDHSHDPDLSPRDALRGVVNGQINTVLPNSDEGLAKFALALGKYSGKRIILRLRLKCSSLPTRGEAPQRG